MMKSFYNERTDLKSTAYYRRMWVFNLRKVKYIGAYRHIWKAERSRSCRRYRECLLEIVKKLHDEYGILDFNFLRLEKSFKSYINEYLRVKRFVGHWIEIEFDLPYYGMIQTQAMNKNRKGNWVGHIPRHIR